MTKSDVERLLQHMCVKQVLKEYLVSNKMGFVSSYIKVGPMARQLENGQMKIILMTTDENSAPNPPVNNTMVSSATKSAVSASGSKWPSRKRKNSVPDNMQVPEPVTKTPTTKVSRVSKKKVDGVAKATPSTSAQQSANMQCFQELMDKRSEVCARENIQCHHFLSNSAIGEISKRLPTSMAALSEVKGLEARQLSRFGNLILDICKRFE